MSSPRFWDRFSLKLEPERFRIDQISPIQRALVLVKFYIERTKDHPFSFMFTGSSRTTKYSFRILETLVAHADPWYIACLTGHEKYLYKSLPEAKGRFRQLHSLQIRFFLRSEHRIPLDVFQDAPNLTRVWRSDYCQLPWSTLAVLHIDKLDSARRIYENLGEMTSLEELVAKGFPDVGHDVPNTSPIELPSLKLLSTH